MQELKEKESRIEELLQEGNKEAAVQSLYELIISYAEQRDFPKAEALRNRLYQVDPMAIQEIAQSGEIIEQKKHQSLDPEHIELWSGLYSKLSDEEANMFYYSLSTAHFALDAPLFQEGDTDRHLYFVEKGQLRLSFHSGNRETHVANMGPGEVLGAETFFVRTSKRTFSAIPLIPVQTSVLHPTFLEKWDQDAKNLQSLLYDFCYRSDRIPELLEKLELDRREQRRVQVKGTIAVQVLDNAGNPVSRFFKGEIQNISSGGLAFSNSFKKGTTAQSLLGRRVALICKLSVQGVWKDLKKMGQVVGAQSHTYNEYSFNVRFDRPISPKFVASLDSSESSGKSPDLNLEV
ncbi:MAG: cyclic nucleotide-binding domain-containing protein [Desulfohalobiaceae bacterium]